jgi:hypothetical protein
MAVNLSRDVGLQLLGNTIPTGAMLVVLITILGPISGAHFNPAVTLVFLARRRGKLVPRDQVERLVHPDDNHDVSNVVDVLMLRLRKKLGRELITTRRGQGFIIDA